MPPRTARAPRPSTHRRLPARALVAAGIIALSVGIAVPASAAIGSAVAAPPSPADTTVRALDVEAANAVADARALAKRADGRAGTIDLHVQIAQLDDAAALPDVIVAAFTDQLSTTTGEVQTALTAYEKKQAAAAAARAAALEKVNTPDGARAVARTMMADKYGWGAGQFSCLNSLWKKESGWNYRSYNGGSGATGIPQALPGSKMATAGADWRTNAATQIAWGLGYIARAYGTPCAAWSHSQATDWY